MSRRDELLDLFFSIVVGLALLVIVLAGFYRMFT